MKKKITILLVGFIIGFVLQNQAQNSKGFKITAQFKGLPDKTKVYLITQQNDTISTAVSKGENFTFNGNLTKNGRFHFIVVDTLVSKSISKAIFLVNTSMTVLGEVGRSDVKVKGSPAQMEFEELVKRMNILDDPRHKLLMLSRDIEIEMANKKDDESLIRLLSNKKKEIWERILVEDKAANDEKKLIVLEWIENHKTSLYAPYVIIGYKVPLGDKLIQNAYNNLSPEIKASYYGVELKKELDNLSLATKVKLGSFLPDFELTSSDNKKFSILQSLKKSKLTLIDFWASWCSPCRAEVPNMKNVYDAFNTKGFNIIGVSSDANEIAWKKALGEDKTPWIHGRDNIDKASKEIFSIGAIPAFALVDGDGKLIAFQCAMSNIPSFGPPIRGEELYNTIETLLKEKNK